MIKNTLNIKYLDNGELLLAKVTMLLKDDKFGPIV